jgi:hypothetical protein
MSHRLEDIATSLRQAAMSSAAVGIQATLADAATTLRELDAMLPRREIRPAELDYAIIRAGEPPSGLSPITVAEFRTAQRYADQLVAEHTRTNSPSATASSSSQTPAPPTTTDQTQDQRLAMARARIATYRARNTRPPEVSLPASHLAVQGRSQEPLDLTQPLAVHINAITGGPSQPLLAASRPGSAAEARHRARGYHREDANGDPSASTSTAFQAVADDGAQSIATPKRPSPSPGPAR